MRDIRLDLGRCVAALMVVYVHFSVNFLSSYQAISLQSWIVADITNSIGRVCVPLFVMMSGALLIGKPIPSWLIFMKRRLSATLKPYFFGALIYFLWQAAKGNYPPSPYEYARSVISGDGSLYLYFLFILLAMYIVTPLFQGIEKVSDASLAATVALLFSLAAIDRHMAPFGLTLGWLSLGNCMSYLPYFLTGYLLYRRRNYIERYALVGFALATTVTVFLVWLLTVRPIGPYAVENITQYTSINVIVQTVFSFSLLQQINVTWGPAVSLVSWFADKALGIFIIHFIILSEMPPFFNSYGPIPLTFQMVFYPPIAFVISAGVVYILHKVPYVKGFV